MSDLETAPQVPEPPLPGWLEVLLILVRVAGIGLLLIGGFALRMLRRFDPSSALLLVVVLALGIWLIVGIKWYARMLYRDSRAPRPSRFVATINIVFGGLLAACAYYGADLRGAEFRLVDTWVLGVHPNTMANPAAMWAFAAAAAVGLTLVMCGLATCLGMRWRLWLGASAFLLLWLAVGWGATYFAPLRRIASLEANPQATYLRPLHDGRRIVTASSNEVWMYAWDTGLAPPKFQRIPNDWFVHQGEAIRNVGRDGFISGLAVSPDDKLIIGYGDWAMVAWSAETGAIVWQQERGCTEPLFSPDSLTVRTARGNETHYLDAASGKPIAEPPEAGSPQLSAAKSYDQTRLAQLPDGNPWGLPRTWYRETLVKDNPGNLGSFILRCADHGWLDATGQYYYRLQRGSHTLEKWRLQAPAAVGLPKK